MYNNLGVQRYREADINSMTKEKMIVLLYEQVVSDLEAARRAIADGDRLEMTCRVNHSQRIIAELRGALDHSIGGDISRNLESLYDYLFHEHLQVLVDQDDGHIDNCIKVLTPLLEAWRRIPAGTGDNAARRQAQGLQPEPVGANPASGSGGYKQEAAPDEVAEAVTEPGVDVSNLVSLSA